MSLQYNQVFFLIIEKPEKKLSFKKNSSPKKNYKTLEKRRTSTLYYVLGRANP
jgi:hypothetical protein